MPDPDGAQPTRHDLRWATVLGLFLLGVYLLTMGGHTYSVDDETYLAGTRALVNGQTVIAPDETLDDVLSLTTHKDGGLTTVAPIGTLALLAPFYLLGALVALPFDGIAAEEIVRLVFSSANSVFTAVTAALLVLLGRSLGVSLRSSLLVGLVYGLGTWAWVHAQTGFSEPGTAMLLTATMLASVRWWRLSSSGWFNVSPDAGVRFAPPGRRQLLAAALVGLLAGCTVLTRTTTAAFLPVFALAGVLARPGAEWRDRLRELVAVGLGGLLPAVVFAANSWLRFGSPLDLGYAGLQYDTPLYEGIFGQFASSGKGIFWYAPVTLVALFALRQSYLRERRFVLTVGAVVLAHVFFFSRFHVWSGENAYGPRYMTVVLPLMVALVLPVVDQAPHWRRGVAIAGVVGLVVPGLLGTLMYFNGVYHHARDDVPANVGLPSLSSEQYWAAWNFQPRSSPLVLHARALPDLWDNSIARVTGGEGGITEIPPEYELRIHWYARSVELDTWWSWWPAKNGPAAAYAFVVVPLASLAGAVLLARRASVDPVAGSSP